ncbi:MAG TPA: hypothetical protein VN240_11595, partial [Propylenella sp.]|nr:hypothetical protein [Propylenella sp.]
MARAEIGIAGVKYGSADGLAVAAAPAWPTMRRLVREMILPNWRILAGGVAAMIVMAATTGVLPFLLQKVGDDIFIDRNATVLYVLPIAVVAVMTLR